MEAAQTHRTFGRSMDYLGVLGKTLGDLAGWSSLAFELIQNAEDARASWIRFNLSDDALVVDNDGVFSDCQCVEADECPWKTDPTIGHRCDFHRFRNFAGADKREQLGTVGAFGIGFTSVYQVTDTPEIISGRRHWIIDDTRPEQYRITECPGCIKCSAPDLPGTRIVLPWARNPDSELRKKLRAETVPNNVIALIQEELSERLPHAILFLKHLRLCEVLHNGATRQKIEREIENDRILMTGGLGDQLWIMLRGDFESTANQLRRVHSQIEEKRSSAIAIAIPEHVDALGLLNAFLPTRHFTGLLFHIQADFFPSSDRKRIVFDGGYAASWNAAAIEGAAELLSQNLTRLRDALKPSGIWEIAESVNSVAQEVENGEKEDCFGEFWELLAPELREHETILLSTKAWANPSKSLLLGRSEEELNLQALERLGLRIVDPSLRPFFTLLRSNEIGVPLLDVTHIVDRVKSIASIGPLDPTTIADFLPVDHLSLIWKEIEILLQRQRKESEKAHILGLLRTCPIVPCLDGNWRSGATTYFASEAAIDACWSIGLQLPFAAPVAGCSTIIESCCVELTVAAAVQELEDFIASDPDATAQLKESAPFCKWLGDQEEQWINNRGLVNRIRALPIFPSREGLKPLTQLSLPGDFVDPLGIADLIDVEALNGRSDFVRSLRVSELTFIEYARTHLHKAFQSDDVAYEIRRKAVSLLADRLGEVADDDEICERLVTTRCVECEDGSWQAPEKVYRATDLVNAVFGDSVFKAVDRDQHKHAIDALYDWLRIEKEPRVTDVVSLVTTAAATKQPLSQELISQIVEYLGNKLKESGIDEGELSQLRNIKWLPAKGSAEPQRPSEIYATFREYLFSSSAAFLDVPPGIQRAATEFLQELHVGINPTPLQVASHLLRSTDLGISVNDQVFDFLNEHAEEIDSSMLARLRQAPFIEAGTHRYPPTHAFWSDHDFGSWRVKLDHELRPYQALFDQLGVHETPTPDDAISVLRQLANEFGTANSLLSEEARAVAISCWRLLSHHLEIDSGLSNTLAAISEEKVIPGVRQVLERPSDLFFEDRADLARRFPRLRLNIIPRIEGAWQAMSVAGVRLLTKAARVDLIECDAEHDDDQLRELLLNRQTSIKRVVGIRDSSGTTNDSIRDISFEAIRYVKASSLTIRYVLPAFGLVDYSDSEDVSAVYLEDENSLYRVPGPSWASVSRELAKIVSGDSDHLGSIAAGIREVLAATSEDVDSILDELGYPPALEESSTVEPAVAAVTLGTNDEEAGNSLGFIDEGGDRLDDPCNVTSNPELMVVDTGSRENEATQRSSSTDDDATDRPNRSQTDTLPDTDRTNERNTRPQSRLRSYVTSRSGKSSSQLSELSKARSALDQAGIRRVMDFERQQGRKPTEMPHGNPGFDIESRDTSGQIVRFIEVKSTGADWGDRGVALSDVQFDQARVERNKFWMYVVTRPEESEWTIYCINDPADRISQYVFDGGWQAVSDEVVRSI